MKRQPAGVPTWLRGLNAVALIVFLVGAGVYGRAWLGMRALESYEAPEGAAPFAGLARFNHYWELSRLGFWLVAAAAGLAVIAAVLAVVVRRRRAATGEESGQPS